ncbi:MAG: BNR repeat-containing protein [Puniceicoccaceae bacterium]
MKNFDFLIQAGRSCRLLCLFVLLFETASAAELELLDPPEIVGQSSPGKAWVANRVFFDLHTVGDRQFIAYYDEERDMTVGMREVGSDAWQTTELPSKLMWDSHNSVVMGIDPAGYIHVSGNMHVHPLDYFRSAKPYDTSEMIEVDRMVGEDEDRVTYPKFFHNREGDLLFSYRSGSCGNGNILVNRFNTDSLEWERYLQVPLFEGVEESDDRAAYHSFVKDSSGNFHFIWIWRWTPMVETSHQICYATTPDMKTWKNAAGDVVSLPFRPDDPAVIVDGTPSGGGMHNGRYKIILTREDEPVVGYIKYDEVGLTQFYMARHDGSEWQSRKISDWDFRWEFFGGGDGMSSGGSFRFAGLSEEGHIVVDWSTEVGQSGRYVINPKTLEPAAGPVRFHPQMPVSIQDRLTDRPGLSVRMVPGTVHGDPAGSSYILKWESGPASHGRNAPEVMPSGPLSDVLILEYK